jgi:hypothetical protein
MGTDPELQSQIFISETEDIWVSFYPNAMHTKGDGSAATTRKRTVIRCGETWCISVHVSKLFHSCNFCNSLKRINCNRLIHSEKPCTSKSKNILKKFVNLLNLKTLSNLGTRTSGKNFICLSLSGQDSDTNKSIIVQFRGPFLFIISASTGSVRAYVECAR